MNWFRRKQVPEPAPEVSLTDKIVLSAWGLTEAEWMNLPPEHCAWYRANIVHAERRRTAFRPPAY